MTLSTTNNLGSLLRRSFFFHGNLNSFNNGGNPMIRPKDVISKVNNFYMKYLKVYVHNPLLTQIWR